MSLDSVINCLGKRFNHFKNISSKFHALDPKYLDNIDMVNNLEIFIDAHSDVKLNQNGFLLEFLSFKNMYNEIMSSSNMTSSSVENLKINVSKFVIARNMGHPMIIQLGSNGLLA